MTFTLVEFYFLHQPHSLPTVVDALLGTLSFVHTVPERLESQGEVESFFASLSQVDTLFLNELLGLAYRRRPGASAFALGSYEPLLANLRTSVSQVSQRSQCYFDLYSGRAPYLRGWRSWPSFTAPDHVRVVARVDLYGQVLAEAARPLGGHYVHRPKTRWGLLQPLRILESIPEEWRDVVLGALRNGFSLEDALLLPGLVTADGRVVK